MLQTASQAQALLSPLSPCVVFVTCATLDEAETLATLIVTESLAACVNLIPGVRSMYLWEGRLCQEQEVQLVIKTHAALLSAVEAKITALHTYDVPEFVVLPIVAGSEAYLNWMADMTRVNTSKSGNIETSKQTEQSTETK